MNRTILLVEDNIDILEANRLVLEMSGYTVITAATLKQARQQISASTPNLIILDILLPDGSGLDFCVQLRENNTNIPILCLSALSQNADIVKGLRSGADDYLPKPYDYNVLLARIEALLRRTHTDPVHRLGPFTVDYLAQRVYKDGRDLLLKPREVALLQLFADNPGTYFPPTTIYERIWGGESLEDIRTVYAHVSSLRRKMELYGDSPILIEQQRGKGYRLVNNGLASPE